MNNAKLLIFSRTINHDVGLTREDPGTRPVNTSWHIIHSRNVILEGKVLPESDVGPFPELCGTAGGT